MEECFAQIVDPSPSVTVLLHGLVPALSRRIRLLREGGVRDYSALMLEGGCRVDNQEQISN